MANKLQEEVKIYKGLSNDEIEMVEKALYLRLYDLEKDHDQICDIKNEEELLYVIGFLKRNTYHDELIKRLSFAKQNDYPLVIGVYSGNMYQYEPDEECNGYINAYEEAYLKRLDEFLRSGPLD